RGQAYDGCSVMSGQYNALQAKFLRENKYAKYLYCASHSLNLVLNDAIHGVLEAKEFFDTVGGLWTFFHSSAKRWDILNPIDADICKALKLLSDTWWSARDEVIICVWNYYLRIMKGLTLIILK
ncbi:unnamed protein product, partial [Meganyctiphanes norvegica]